MRNKLKLMKLTKKKEIKDEKPEIKVKQEENIEPQKLKRFSFS